MTPTIDPTTSVDAHGWAALPVDVQRQFTVMGWTRQQWETVHNRVNHHDEEGFRLRAWLESPPARFTNLVSSQTVFDTFCRYGPHADDVLNAYAAGASARFVTETIFYSEFASTRSGLPPGGVRNDDPAQAWVTIHQVAGMTEAAATGWAHTGELFSLYPKARKQTILDRLTPWTDRFGPTAYLFILAGFTLEEAASLKETGVQVSEQQLRVMVALSGIVLAPGI